MECRSGSITTNKWVTGDLFQHELNEIPRSTITHSPPGVFPCYLNFTHDQVEKSLCLSWSGCDLKAQLYASSFGRDSTIYRFKCRKLKFNELWNLFAIFFSRYVRWKVCIQKHITASNFFRLPENCRIVMNMIVCRMKLLISLLYLHVHSFWRFYAQNLLVLSFVWVVSKLFYSRTFDYIFNFWILFVFQLWFSILLHIIYFIICRVTLP